MLSGSMQPMRITLNTDDFDTVKSTSNGEDPTTTDNLDFVKRAMQVA